MKQTWKDLWAIFREVIAGTRHYVGVYAKVGEYAEQAVSNMIEQDRIESQKELEALKNL